MVAKALIDPSGESLRQLVTVEIHVNGVSQDPVVEALVQVAKSRNSAGVRVGKDI